MMVYIILELYSKWAVLSSETITQDLPALRAFLSVLIFIQINQI